VTDRTVTAEKLAAFVLEWAKTNADAAEARCELTLSGGTYKITTTCTEQGDFGGAPTVQVLET
jgi:hypothetical protein